MPSYTLRSPLFRGAFGCCIQVVSLAVRCQAMHYCVYLWWSYVRTCFICYFCCTVSKILKHFHRLKLPHLEYNTYLKWYRNLHTVRSTWNTFCKLYWLCLFWGAYIGAALENEFSPHPGRVFCNFQFAMPVLHRGVLILQQTSGAGKFHNVASCTKLAHRFFFFLLVWDSHAFFCFLYGAISF